MKKDLLDQLSFDIPNVSTSFQESYNKILENIETIDKEDYNLETKIFVIKSSMKHLLQLTKTNFDLQMANAKMLNVVIQDVYS